ncbi:hypothetical protein PILCRDRAFT_3541 [Piloderma croceum F 1598]|uniref:non-specific serine/threonine protein kinase n=1 Tax=Piloderma croceum (strain F 1598) TaxID=765440 RepID=A0A0C3G7Q6_PILCF|nr:hypothetical protein PILCRDRAFT_3541 [Piloderma croceum F 1598]
MDLVRIDGRYRLERRVGSGSYGEIYITHDILSGQDVTTKLEPIEGGHFTLEHEFHVYLKLGRGTGIPCIHWFGTEAGFNAVVMCCLGQSLAELFIHCKFQFSVKTVLQLGSQLISCLQFIHSHNFIHCDLKPSNIVMGVGKHANVAHIIDFGLSKEFRDPHTRLHIPYGNTLGLTKTLTFTSIQSHLGMELGRRDDLESLAYILIYFLHSSLPWQGLYFQGHDLVAESKQSTSTHDLCYGLPPALRTFLKYSHLLSFNAKPDYDYLRSIFNDLLLREGFNIDMIFDWGSSDGRVNEQLSSSPKHNKCPKQRTGLGSQAQRGSFILAN